MKNILTENRIISGAQDMLTSVFASFYEFTVRFFAYYYFYYRFIFSLVKDA